MAMSNPFEPVLKTIFRSSRLSSSRYICAPCLQQHQHLQTVQRRHASRSLKRELPVPQPTPFVPDVQTFLTLIGRGLVSQSSKIPSWESLFTLTSEEFKEAGIEPARTRRYLLRWRDKFRRGIYGPGGDFKHVKDGTAHLRVVEVPCLPKFAATANSAAYATTSSTPGKTKLVLNVPEGEEGYVLEGAQNTTDLKKPRGYSLKSGRIVAGPFALPVKGANGSGAIVKVVEGMWEDRLGKKVYGGERRRAETLHKLGVAEHRKAAGTAR